VIETPKLRAGKPVVVALPDGADLPCSRSVIDLEEHDSSLSGVDRQAG